MLIEAEISSFALDPERNTPVLILKECSGVRTLPVPLGPLEASAIAMETLRVTPEKPLTIDLVRLMMEKCGGSLQRVVLHDIINQSLAAKIQVAINGGVLLIDCRSSDAIALALRCKAPVFVDDRVFSLVNAPSGSPAKELRRRIRAIDTIEFGNYHLE
jgi:uncharacterized protein